ncbi:MAG: hypothetical protein ACT4OX_10075 [Actinomycetota bacterium]
MSVLLVGGLLSCSGDDDNDRPTVTTEDPTAVSALPTEWDAGNATFRSPEGWKALDDDALAEFQLDFAIEAADGSGHASLTVDHIARSLEDLEALYGAQLLLQIPDFDQDGAAVRLTIPGADGALLVTARFDRRFDDGDTGPAVGAFVTAKKGDDAYLFSAIAKDEPDNHVLVEEIARSLAID